MWTHTCESVCVSEHARLVARRWRSSSKDLSQPRINSLPTRPPKWHLGIRVVPRTDVMDTNPNTEPDESRIPEPGQQAVEGVVGIYTKL